ILQHQTTKESYLRYKHTLSQQRPPDPAHQTRTHQARLLRLPHNSETGRWFHSRRPRESLGEETNRNPAHNGWEHGRTTSNETHRSQNRRTTTKLSADHATIILLR